MVTACRSALLRRHTGTRRRNSSRANGASISSTRSNGAATPASRGERLEQLRRVRRLGRSRRLCHGGRGPAPARALRAQSPPCAGAVVSEAIRIREALARLLDRTPGRAARAWRPSTGCWKAVRSRSGSCRTTARCAAFRSVRPMRCAARSTGSSGCGRACRRRARLQRGQALRQCPLRLVLHRQIAQSVAALVRHGRLRQQRQGPRPPRPTARRPRIGPATQPSSPVHRAVTNAG